MKNLAIFILILFFFFAANETLTQTAPSVRDSIPVITSRVFTREIKGDESEFRFAFWANAGEVKITAKVTAKDDNAGAYLYFRDKNDEDLIPFLLAQGVVGTLPETVTDTLSFEKKTLVYVTVKDIKYGSRNNYRGNLQITFGGSFIEGKKSKS